MWHTCSGERAGPIVTQCKSPKMQTEQQEQDDKNWASWATAVWGEEAICARCTQQLVLGEQLHTAAFQNTLQTFHPRGGWRQLYDNLSSYTGWSDMQVCTWITKHSDVCIFFCLFCNPKSMHIETMLMLQPKVNFHFLAVYIYIYFNPWRHQGWDTIWVNLTSVQAVKKWGTPVMIFIPYVVICMKRPKRNTVSILLDICDQIIQTPSVQQWFFCLKLFNPHEQLITATVIISIGFQCRSNGTKGNWEAFAAADCYSSDFYRNTFPLTFFVLECSHKC